MKRVSFIAVLTLSLAVSAQSVFAVSVTQTNLTSNVPGQAAVTDPNLRDAWGMSFSATSPIWVSDQSAGVSTLYNALGQRQGGPLVVSIPPGTAGAGPTGQVFAGGTTFRLNGTAVNFIFDTLGGTIAAWNGGTAATTVATTAGASYTGLALANNTLYAANFKAGGGIDVFNSSFAPTTLAGNFTDPNLPSGYAPFNVQNINGTLFVEYGRVTNGVPVALPGGGGYVDEFDINGNLIRRLISNGPLDGPWGVAVVPAAGFGGLASGDVIIGNFSTGTINVFNSNGTFLQMLTDSTGKPIAIDGLWALAFDPGAPGSTDPTALYFTAGPNMGTNGLFGKLDAVPEPAAWGLGLLGVSCLLALRRRSRQQ